MSNTISVEDAGDETLNASVYSFNTTDGEQVLGLHTLNGIVEAIDKIVKRGDIFTKLRLVGYDKIVTIEF
jgi:hypothetical protein